MIDQLGIAVFSLIAVSCTISRSGAVRRWGPIFGLVSQPFWLYATWSAGQWGMLAVSAVYTVVWCRGIYNGWFWK